MHKTLRGFALLCVLSGEHRQEVIVDGKKYDSIAAVCKAFGIKRKVVMRRCMKRDPVGWQFGEKVYKYPNGVPNDVLQRAGYKRRRRNPKVIGWV